MTTVDSSRASMSPRLVGGRLTAWAQYVLAGAFLTHVGGLLLTAAASTGDWAGLRDPSLERYGDPKALLPLAGPAEACNPLFLLACAVHPLSLFVTVPALAAAGAGVVQLLRPSVRAHRRTALAVTGGTLLCLAVVALMATPYGGRLHTWLLD